MDTTELNITFSFKVHKGSTSASAESKKDLVSLIAKMIFWRVILPIIIYYRDTNVIRRKVFYSQTSYYVC